MQDIESLVRRAQNDEHAFREVYDTTIDRVFAYVLLRVRNREDAKELVQEIYVSLWKSLPKFTWQGEESFYGFLWLVVKRRLIRSWLHRPRTVSLDEVYDISAEESPQEDYRHLLSKISLLKKQERLVIELRYFAHNTFDELSRTLGIKESNAKVIHHRALKKLRESLGTYE